MTSRMPLSAGSLDAVRLDIASFADPRTEVSIAGADVTWTQGRQLRKLTLSGDERIRVTYEGVTFDYASFFASETMADLRGLSEELPFSVEASPNYVNGPFISAR